MRILLVNKFAHLEGGAARYILDLYHLLTSKGHEVAFFAMKQKGQLTVNRQQLTELYERWGNYWVSAVETKQVMWNWQGLRTAGRFLWSWEAQKKLKNLIVDFKPDIIHLNAISHQISPSIIPVIGRFGIPVVMTVHDYTLLYPDYVLKITQWDDFLAHRFWAVVRKRQVMSSRVLSFLTWFEFTLHRALGVYKNVDHFIAPSLWLKTLMIQEGFWNVTHLPNPFFDRGSEQKEGESILCYGRFSQEKGIMELLESYQRCLDRGIMMPTLVFIGEGPLLTRLQERVGLSNLANKVIIKQFQGSEPTQEIAEARFVVVPSYPYFENFPYVVLEAYACGKPVLSSGLGGLQEVVREGETGWNVLGQTEEVDREEYIERLVKTLKRAVSSPDEELKRMGSNARAYVERLNPEWYDGELMKIYKSVINKQSTVNKNAVPQS